MTTARRDGNESPFSEWIRGEPGLHSIRDRICIHDTDYWIHQYRARRDRVGERMVDSILAIELKTHEARLGFAQRDTLRLVAAGMRQAFYTKDGKVRTLKIDCGNEIRIVRIYGYFLLRLQDDRPDTDGWIEWHGRQIDKETLIKILRFDIDPRTLRERSDRRHHVPSKKQSHPDLFLVDKQEIK